MGHMGTGHEKTTVADFGHAAIVLGAGVNGYVLANIAVRPDRKPGRSAPILDRLRRRAERGEGIDDGARPDGGVAGDVNVGNQPAPLAHHHVLPDDAVWTNRCTIADPSARRDACGRIDCAQSLPHKLVMTAPTSASATIWPATLASPRYHHMFLRLAIFVM